MIDCRETLVLIINFFSNLNILLKYIYFEKTSQDNSYAQIITLQIFTMIILRNVLSTQKVYYYILSIN